MLTLLRADGLPPYAARPRWARLLPLASRAYPVLVPGRWYPVLRLAPTGDPWLDLGDGDRPLLVRAVALELVMLPTYRTFRPADR